MTWFDDLRRVTIAGKEFVGASFRGVPFFVESDERTGGRRTATHEFPFRNKPFREDLGQRAGGFRIEGYVLGDDYMAQRDALLDALEGQDGPGELVHPQYGTISAICENVSVRHTKNEGGFAFFAIDFGETPAQAPAPTEVVDGAEQVSDSADLAAEATEAELVEQYDTDDLPAFALESAQTAVTNAAAALQERLAPIITATQELATFAGRIELLTTTASSLVRTPASVLGSFREAITGLVETILAAPGEVMNALFEAYAADLGALVDPITSTRERELANQVALIAGLRRVLALEAARLAPTVAYESIDAAIDARDQVAALLEEQAGTADDTAYPAIVELRSQVLRAVPGGKDFARVVTVTRNEPIPSLLLAYQLYGSVDRELDVVARNAGRIFHPGFCSGDLKALSDG